MGHRMGRSTRAVAATVVLLAGAGLTACSDDDDAADETTTSEAEEESSTTTIAETTTTRPEVVNTGESVELIDFSYLPTSVTVAAGQSITWTNAGENRHTVTSDGDMFASSTPIQPGQSYVQAFPTPGTYAYYCTFHPDEMTGTITVE